jgi:hypothetical protein
MPLVALLPIDRTREVIDVQLESFERGPRRFLRPELARVGVEVVGAKPIRLRCRICGCEWTPRVEADGRIAALYWVCQSGCNVVKV